MMDRHTFGTSQAAINLVEDILPKQEPLVRRRASRVLSKQIVALKAITGIPDKGVRETTLLMWHGRFKELTESLPEILRDHIRCVETGLYRALMRESQRGG